MQRSVFGWLCCVLLCLGCSGGSDKSKANRPQTAIAKGVVTYNGKPLDDALIVFVPEANDGTAASAVTDSSGGFSMMAFPPESGAVPGKYKVTVSKMIDPPVAQFDESSHDAPPPKTSKPKSLIPIKYSQPHTSNLTAEVPVEGAEALKLELKD